MPNFPVCQIVAIFFFFSKGVYGDLYTCGIIKNIQTVMIKYIKSHIMVIKLKYMVSVLKYMP